MENTQVDNVETASQEQHSQTAAVETENQGQPAYTQSDLDKAIAKALRTREKEFEKRLLAKDEDWKTLYEQSEREKEEIRNKQAKKDYIIQHNLTSFADVFEDVPVDRLDTVRTNLEKMLKTEIEKRVNEALKTPKPVANSGPAKSMDLDSIIKNKDWKAYEEYRKQHGIHKP